MTALAGVVGGLMEMTPPDLPDVTFADIRRGASMLGPLRRLGRKRIPELARVLPMSVVDLMDEFFESPAVKGAIGASAILGVTYGPMESGTALAMLSNWAQSGTGLFRSASVVRGGIGALTAAMAEAARDFGAEIRTGAPVAKITVEGRRTTGVELDSGEHIAATVVASATDVTSTFLDLVGPRSLDARFVRHVRAIKYRGSATRIHLALSGLPEFTSLAGSDGAPLSGPIQISPSLAYVEKAYDPIKYGRYAKAPYLDMLIPTLSDPGLAPDGQHLLSMTAKFAPFELRAGSWNEHAGAFADAAVETLAEYAPGIEDLILSRHVISLADLQGDYGLVEGSPNHGDMTLDHFMHMRPIPGYARYRTPIEGLYLCSAASHPGWWCDRNPRQQRGSGDPRGHRIGLQRVVHCYAQRTPRSWICSTWW